MIITKRLFRKFNATLHYLMHYCYEIRILHNVKQIFKMSNFINMSSLYIFVQQYDTILYILSV